MISPSHIASMADRELERLEQFIRDRHASVTSMAEPKALKVDADSWMYIQLKEAERWEHLRGMAQDIARLTTCPLLPLMRAD